MSSKVPTIDLKVAITWSKDSLELPDRLGVFIPEALLNAGITQLAANISDSCYVADLPLHHNDPFDRLLIAQAKANGLRLFSNDPIFKKYDVDVFWL